MSYRPKVFEKMNGYFHQLFSCIETVIHPAAGKAELRKQKRRTSKPPYALQASPDSLHIRASVRMQNPVRHNPAP